MNIIEIQNVSKFYANHTALNKVSFNVPKQSVYGLLGPNGAGKTSLIRIINQITAADEGQILFNGEKLNPKHISSIGYLPEERGLYKKMKVGEQLLYLAQLKGLSKQEAKSKIKTWMVKFEIQNWWDKNVEELSKGMQQKVQFISTVLHEPELIILDEPFSGFDPINANLIKDEILKLRENGSTIIFSTHRMESVEEICDHITLINNAENILTGKLKDIQIQFKQNVFEIISKGDFKVNGGNYEVVEQKELEPGIFNTKVKLIGPKNSNELLKVLLDQVEEVIGFKEILPNTNDIFIQQVTGIHA